MVQVGEIVWGEDFALQDGEVDFDLIEPAGVDWPMDKGQAWELLFESCDGGLPAMRAPIVDDPKDTAGVVVGRASHDLLNKTIEGRNTSGCLAAAKDTGMMNIKSRDVSPGSATIVFMFNAQRAFRRGGQRGMLAPPSLNAGLLVSGDDKFIAFEGFVSPAAIIQIEDSVGLDGEAGIPGEDPTAVIPRANGVFMKPPPNGAPRDSGDQARIADLAGNVRNVPVGERNAMSGGQLASQRLNLNYQFWGEQPGDDPDGSALPDRRVALRRSAFATC